MLSTKYQQPRAALVRLLDRPRALEEEIAVLISDQALQVARGLMEDGDFPDESDTSMHGRAVVGHWRRLRDQAIREHEAAGGIAMLKAMLEGMQT